MPQACPPSINILLTVWGKEYIKNFLQFSLPSLLAPGNIPAMANTYPTQFTLLTKSSDITLFENHPSFKKLKTFCTIKFISIEDLIVFGNYSTTLTLAYDRAIKQTGTEMLNTYFVFLTADYIMANGSLTGLMRYIKKGYSGICAGNFQVIQEEIAPFLRKNIDKTTQSIQISPRLLLEKSFQHLHPIVFANMYEQNVMHNDYVNRFFLRYDEHVMAGRFYLLHMLCIKPETINYQIGSSCDYSFIPEMCPSGNIAIINDSDDYLVVEMQAKNHELNYLSWGQYRPKRLAHVLAEWTTAQHRENAKQSIYFHTRDITQNEKIIIEKNLANFIDRIQKNLTKYKVKSARNHPYWIGAIKSFHNQRQLIENNHDYDYFDLTKSGHVTLIKKIYSFLFGKPPKVFRWHPRYREYQSLMKTMRKHIAAKNQENIIVFYATFYVDLMYCYTWLKEKIGVMHQYHLKNLIHSKSKKLNELKKIKFATGFLLMTMEQLKNMPNFLKEIKILLKDDAKIVILIPNETNNYPSMINDFRENIIREINFNIIGTKYKISNIETIHNNLTMFSAMMINMIHKATGRHRKLKILIYGLLGTFAGFFCLIKNSMPKFLSDKKEHCTHVLLTIELT